MTKYKFILLWVILGLFSFTEVSNATDKKISELTPLTGVASNDVIPLNDVSVSTTKSATVSRILETVSGVDFAPANSTYLTLTSNGTLSAEVPLGVVDDSTFVGSGATIEAKVLPSCSNATTSKLLYNNITNAFSCGSDQNSGGGGGLGVNLTSTGTLIISDTGTIGFGDNDLVTTGTMKASHFVATSGSSSYFTDMEVINQLLVPTIQNCSTTMVTGEICIDGNISGVIDSLVFMGQDGYERVNINMLKSDIVSITDGDTFAYEEDTGSWEPIQAVIPLWGGTEGSLIYPLTSATTDFIIGGDTTGAADIWLKATGGAIFNQNNADLNFNVQGDTSDYLIYTDGDQVMIGTNTPATNSILTVSGTITIEGTMVGFMSFGTGTSIASADPCTGAGSDVVPINSFFMKTGGVPCYCDASGVDKKVVDDSACF